jgi:ParB-like chromosome segregation protein Spo0J
MNDIETIGGYTVHPAAAVFPLIEGDDFNDLCESIRTHGVQHPAVVHGNELLDGRNRMRACEALKAEGWSGSCPVVEWKDDGRNVAEWIWDTNALRRHMDDDGITMASSAIWPLIARENEARKEAAQFKKGQSGNPTGKKQVDTKSCPPAKRDTKAKHEASTVGQVAAKAGTSKHKARQAIAVQKAVEAGELPADTAKDVMSGKKKLKDVAPKPTRKPRAKKHRAMKDIISDLRDIIAEWKNADHNVEVLRDELTTHLERI